ncbi:MAG: hypothetical protein ACYTXE_07645 [Nostoc sp.]
MPDFSPHLSKPCAGEQRRVQCALFFPLCPSASSLVLVRNPGYRDRIKGDRADNIENAIAAYNAALTVRTREALPQNWAATQNNLAKSVEC